MRIFNSFVHLCVVIIGFLVRNTLSDGYQCSQSGAGPPDMMMHGTMNHKYMWSKSGGRVLIPVVMDPKYSYKERDTILGGLMEIERKTCVEFYIFNSTSKLNGYDYVYITRSKSRGCWSYVGRVGGGRQDLSLPPGCISHRTSIHEMMHALGFPHEHVRADRDNYVHVLWGNIQPGRERNFERKVNSPADAFGPYDYSSIMHYDRRAFSLNGLDTVRPLKSGSQIGTIKVMSHWDARKVNAMYKCGSRRGTGSHHRHFNSFPLFNHPENSDSMLTHNLQDAPTGPDDDYYDDPTSNGYTYNYIDDGPRFF